MFTEKVGKIIWISPNEIMGVEKRGKIYFPHHGLYKSDYESAVIWIRKAKCLEDNGIPKEKYETIEPFKKAIKIFFDNPIRVSWVSDHYELGDDGRHRVKIAQLVMCDVIPVLLVDIR